LQNLLDELDDYSDNEESDVQKVARGLPKVDWEVDGRDFVLGGFVYGKSLVMPWAHKVKNDKETDIFDTVSWLESLGIPLNQPKNLGKLLWEGLEDEHWKRVKFYLEAIPNFIKMGIDFVDSDGQTALIMAVGQKRFDIVGLLIGNGANLDHRPRETEEHPGYTALEIALTPHKSFHSFSYMEDHYMEDMRLQFLEYVKPDGEVSPRDFKILATAAFQLLEAGAHPKRNAPGGISEYGLKTYDAEIYWAVQRWIRELEIVRENCKYSFLGDLLAQFLYNEDALRESIHRMRFFSFRGNV